MTTRAIVAAMALLSGVCAASPGRGQTAEPATPPRPRHVSYYYDAFKQGVTRPISRATDAALLVRKTTGRRREAANVDDLDQVRLPSRWWQPRLGFRPVSVEQMLRGPGRDPGPAPGKLMVTKLKTQGVSPGFTVKDSRGERFAIKFDPPNYPELATGADVVVSYLYWAAGYNVPENSIVTFRRGDLEIATGADYRDETGKKRPLTAPVIDHALSRVRVGPDGTYRAVASRWIAGGLGEWEYQGRRRDDPEDLIPHELRRDVRGLWTLCAWVNNTDCSARNTFDAWVTEGGRSFVRHYLIDFSGALGSSSIAPQAYSSGSEYLLDYRAAGASIATLGLHVPRWERAIDPQIPSVGFIESQVFDPEHWRPFLPNPAFDEATDRDLRWGARIVGAFTDEHIRAAVAMGKYYDPRASEYLTKTLIERRDKLVKHWLGAENQAAAEVP
jgi:hypothetical protein